MPAYSCSFSLCLQVNYYLVFKNCERLVGIRFYYLVTYLQHCCLCKLYFFIFIACSYENIEKYNVVVYGAASPAKFADVLEKVNVKWTGQDLLKELSAKESRYTDWEENDDWSEKLLALLETIDQRVKTTSQIHKGYY